MALKNNGKPRLRGFACMTLEQRTRIAAMGGQKTRKRYGRKHMSKIGKSGRAKRTRLAKKAKKAAKWGLAFESASKFSPTPMSKVVI